MPFVSIPTETFERLALRAAALNVTVDELIAPLLDRAMAGDGLLAPSSESTPFDDWKKNFDAWMAEVHSRSHRFPQGFAMNNSRESIYEGSGE